jgi:hypothetical protein
MSSIIYETETTFEELLKQNITEDEMTSILFRDHENYIETNIEFIPGKQISERETTIINNLINYIKKDNDPICNYYPFDKTIFITHDKIKWNQLQFKIIEKPKKKLYYLFEGDEALYPYSNNMTYIKLKKELLLYFNRLLLLLHGHIDDGIIDYLNIKFFNNINKLKYYNCLNWFIGLFLIFLNSTSGFNICFYRINYKEFRKYIIKHRFIEPEQQIKQILIKFQNICPSTYRHYEDLKVFFNFVIPHIENGWEKHL